MTDIESDLKIANAEISSFLETRKRRGMSTSKFERCFCCGKLIPLDSIPTVVQVDNGIGNRFACAECTEIEATQAGEGGIDE